MGEYRLNRIDKDTYYLNIAKAVSMRSTCLRRQYGAVIVKNDEIIATGYNGSPRGEVNCCDAGYCWREENDIPHGEQYEKVRQKYRKALHEQQRVYSVRTRQRDAAAFVKRLHKGIKEMLLKV